MYEIERYTKILLDKQGNLLEVPLRRGKGDTAFIDTLSFTFHSKAVPPEEIYFYTNEDLARWMSAKLLEIFGFGITGRASHNGKNFFETCWEMKVDDVLYGYVHIGGQRDKLMVELKGKGCECALDGWEHRLYYWLRKAPEAKITRIDITRDFFDEELINFRKILLSYKRGGFDRRGKRPTIEKVGRDWDNNTQEGKSVYIGGHYAAVRTCIYDKAKQYGDIESHWIRFEQRHKGAYAQIPLDVLVDCGAYWNGTYPICYRLSLGSRANRTIATKRRLEMTIEDYKRYMKRACGKGLNALLSLNTTPEEIIETLRDESGLYPERLTPAAYSIEFAGHQEYIHEKEQTSFQPYAEFF